MGIKRNWKWCLLFKMQNNKKILIISIIISFYLLLQLFHQPSYLCEFINIDYFHKDLDPYFKTIDEINCYAWTPLVYFDDKGNLHENETEIHKLGFKNNLFCSYRCVVPTGPKTYRLQGNYSIHETVNTDVIHVICNDGLGVTVYSDVFYHVNWSKEGFDALKEESNMHPSIMLFGVDSLSALLAERTLPNTLKYVRETLGGIDMKHFNKIGLNTKPNLLAALTGMSMLEAIIPTFKYPSLFQKFLDDHYITCKGEDQLMPLGPLGFKYPIYHHDVRKYFEAVKDIDIFTNINGKMKRPSSSFFCKGNELKHNILLTFNKECFQKYTNKRKLVFSWIVDISHDESNTLQLADNDFLEYFKWMKDTGILENTALFIFGDHGPGSDEFARTDIGRYTHRLPYFNVVLPTSMKISDVALNNLRTNRNRLTTPYDFYETLKDFAFSKHRTSLIAGASFPRGISLFTEIPRTRTCAQAHIPESYCPCYSLEKINIGQKISQLISNFLVVELNSIITGANLTGFCQLWHSPKIISVYKLDISDSLFRRYMITLQVLPQQAEFMASVDVHSQTIKLLNTIDRMNKYGNQPSCLKSIGFFELYKQYCICF